MAGAPPHAPCPREINAICKSSAGHKEQNTLGSRVKRTFPFRVCHICKHMGKQLVRTVAATS